MNKEEIAVTKSRQYLKSRSKAETYLNDPKKLNKLYKDAAAKIEDVPHGPFGATWRYIKAMIRMISAYADGSYRKAPTLSMVMIVAAVIYFISPIDLMPDFIPVIGYIDDALVVTITVSAVKEDLDKFIAWERTKG